MLELTISSGQYSDYELKPYMSAIGFVDKMYARNRLCYLTISRSKTYVSYRFC